MESRVAAPSQTQPLDDVFERESGVTSLIQGIIYWGILALGLCTPIIGGILGELR